MSENLSEKSLAMDSYDLVYVRNPVTVGDREDERQPDYWYGMSSMQGYRRRQEDQAMYKPNLYKDLSYFAVFDGHNGIEVAAYLKYYFHEILLTFLETEQPINALHLAFTKVDMDLRTSAGLSELKLMKSELESSDDANPAENLLKNIFGALGYVAEDSNEADPSKKSDENTCSRKNFKDLVKRLLAENSESEDSEDGGSDGNSSEEDEDSDDNGSGKDQDSDDSKTEEDEEHDSIKTDEHPETKIDLNEVEAGCSESIIDHDKPANQKEEKMGAMPASQKEEKMGAMPASQKEEKMEAMSASQKEEKMGLMPASQKEEKMGPGIFSGSTATVVLFSLEKIYVANVGDSRCIISRNKNACEISEDHEPTLKEEKSRIIKSGHAVKNGRIDGILNLSRSIGDFFLKKQALPLHQQAIIPIPYIKEIKCDNTLDFLVVSSDGIWGSLKNKDVVDFIVKSLDEKEDPCLSETCSELGLQCINNRDVETGDGMDNITTIIVVPSTSSYFKKMPKVTHGLEEPIADMSSAKKLKKEGIEEDKST